MLIAGIDPGVNGAAAIVDHDALRVLDVIDLPVIRNNKLTWVDGAILVDWLEQYRPDLAVVERVHYWPGDKWPSRTAEMERIAGGIEACLSVISCPIHHAHTFAWKKRAGLGTDKANSLALAKARLSWPEGGLRLASHHNRAEAALLALFGRAPPAPPKAPKRSKAVNRLAAENVPPGPLFGVA